MDIYQKRYLNHQKRKADFIKNGYGDDLTYYDSRIRFHLFNILDNRRSQRVFNDEPITEDMFIKLIAAMEMAPSSCDRRGVKGRFVKNRNEIEDISKRLVGGRGWADKAKAMILLYADMRAYKSPVEKDYMPYLDTGFMGQNIYLVCETHTLGCCFINPNVKDKKTFDARYLTKHQRLMGVMALGYYDRKAML